MSGLEADGGSGLEGGADGGSGLEGGADGGSGLERGNCSGLRGDGSSFGC